MKKFLVGLVMMFVFAVTLPLSVEAHNGCYRHRKARKSYNGRSYARTNRSYARTNRYYRTSSANRYYETRGYTSYRRPSFYRRHRNLINIGIATGAGALIGGIAKGRKGAGIGALIGAGAGAVYTYGINKKKRRY